MDKMNKYMRRIYVTHKTITHDLDDLTYTSNKFSQANIYNLYD